MPKPPAHRMRVAHYARIALNSDASRQRLARQAERACAQVHANPHWTLPETTTDIGSGLQMQPGLRQLLDRAREGRFDLLLVERLSDLGRSLDTLTHILSELQPAGVDLRARSGERIDTALLMTVDRSRQRAALTQRQTPRKG